MELRMNVVVVGLSYASVPLTARPGSLFLVTGVDRDVTRAAELTERNDHTGAINEVRLEARKPTPSNDIAFKENVPDLHNTEVVDLVDDLHVRDHAVDIYDPIGDAAKAQREYGEDLVATLDGGVRYNAVVAAIDHPSVADRDLAALTADNALLFDIKCLLRRKVPPGRRFRAL